MAANGDTPHYDIPKECKAAVVENAGPDFTMKIEMVPVPEPGPNDVLLKLNATGLCGSDLHFMMGDLGTGMKCTDYGVRSPGHEGAGVVVKLGANVTNFKIGDRAGIKPIMDTCGSCELCWSDKECYCSKAIFTGMACTGSYQQYVVSPARYTQPIPDGIPDEIAGPIMCSASTIYRSLKDSQLKPGDYAVFPGGGGGVGTQGVQLAKAMGYRPVVVDTGDEKRALSKKMGAETFIDFKEVGDDLAGAVKKATGGVGAHGVFITAPQAYKTAVSLVGDRVGAIVMCIGLPPAGDLLLGAHPTQFCLKNLTIRGTVVASLHDIDRTFDFAKRGMLQPICEVWPFDRLPEGVEKLRKGQVAGRIVCDFNK